MTDTQRPGPSGAKPAGPAKGDATAGARQVTLVTSGDPASTPVRPAPTTEVALAYQGLLAARGSLATELDGLTMSTHAALDIPTKIRRDPLKAAALAGGAGFLLLGGPRKVLRGIGRALPGRKRDPYAGLLPDEVEKVLRDTGLASDPRVREALDRDFAEYLRRKGRVDPQPNARASLWRTYDAVVGPLGSVAARMLVEKLFEATDAGRAPAGAAGSAGGSGRPRG